MVKKLTPSAGDAGDVGLIPGSGRSLEEEMATHSSILAQRISWTERHGRIQSIEYGLYGVHRDSAKSQIRLK